MRFLGFGKKAVEPVIEKKHGETHGDIAGSPIGFLFGTFGVDIVCSYIPPTLAYKFYNAISPLQGTISKIHDAIGGLPLVLRPEDEPDNLIKESPILDMLNNPSPLTTKRKFFVNSAKSIMLTRELFIIARGPITSPPLELVFVNPKDVHVFQDAQSKWPVKIQTNAKSDHRQFFRTEINGRIRYVDENKMNEIYPYIVEDDEGGQTDSFRGISPLTSLKNELLSYSSSILGNTKAIENSGKPSGIISPKGDEFSDEQYQEIVKTLKNEVVGPFNDGKLIMLPFGVEAAFKEWAPKDMDYETLQKNVKTNIWNLWSIPLPLMNETNQTFDNFAQAQVAFYDEAVNESFEMLADALKWMLETRFDMEGVSIWYNPFEVPALKRRAVSMMEDMTKSEVLSVDEVRGSAGFEKTADGDAILVNSKKSPLSAVVEGPSFSTNSSVDAGTE